MKIKRKKKKENKWKLAKGISVFFFSVLPAFCFLFFFFFLSQFHIRFHYPSSPTSAPALLSNSRKYSHQPWPVQRPPTPWSSLFRQLKPATKSGLISLVARRSLILFYTTRWLKDTVFSPKTKNEGFPKWCLKTIIESTGYDLCDSALIEASGCT